MRAHGPAVRYRLLALPILVVFALLAAASTALGNGDRTVFVMDRCEPDSFNAVLGPGGCVRDGGVTFDKFLRQVNPEDGGHNAWRFSSDDVALKPGEALSAQNTGGETHTFTEVANFGTGIVPELNAALPAGTPAAQPLGGLNFIAAGETLELGTLGPGEHLFECLIHPWMRAVVEQSS
jgi:plastocyanin